MIFDAPKLMLAGLIKIELPTGDLRLCDGGFIYFEGEKYVSSDPVYGSIAAMEPIDERVGDEAPDGKMTFFPASTASAAALSSPTFQNSRMRFWLARVTEATGLIEGEPELVADMRLDTTILRIVEHSVVLDITFNSAADRLFNVNGGNVLSSRFHQSVWPGEKGFDNTTGVGQDVAWGVEAAPRGSGSGAGSGMGGAGFVSARPVMS